MNYSRAFQTIRELATENQIDETDIAFADESLAEQREWQKEALDTVDELILNHHEDIDSRFALPDLATLTDHPVGMVQADRSMSPSSPGDALRIVLDLARGNPRIADTDMASDTTDQTMAVSLAEHFIVHHGNELSTSMTTPKL